MSDLRSEATVVMATSDYPHAMLVKADVVLALLDRVDALESVICGNDGMVEDMPCFRLPGHERTPLDTHLGRHVPGWTAAHPEPHP